MSKELIIAIDGPAASGKGTLAKELAEYFQYIYVDTGSMYRAVTYKTIQSGIDVNDEEKIMEMLAHTTITITPEHTTLLDQVDVSEAIRENQVSENVSYVAVHPRVREKLVDLQRDIASQGGSVLDGRDIGTVVLPNADVKIYLTASVEARAMRRQLDNESRGITSTFEQVRDNLALRDKIDSTREVAPLKQADDAILLDSTTLTIPQTYAAAIEIIEQARKNKKLSE
ncbi:MAG: (d)CMP kinase [Culicoidibacterales bacterium]